MKANRISRFIFALIKRAISVGHKCVYGSWGISSYIRKPMRIIGKKNIFIGEQVYILDGLRMETISKWGEREYSPKIKIEDNVTVGQNCHMTCANEIHIGRGCSILPSVLITDIEHEYKRYKSLGETGIQVGSVHIKDYAVIGMGARVLGSKNIVIGKNAVVGTNAVVSKDVPDYAIVAGAPARIIGYVEED